jgi:hypothetical protein
VKRSSDGDIVPLTLLTVKRSSDRDSELLIPLTVKKILEKGNVLGIWIVRRSSERAAVELWQRD